MTKAQHTPGPWYNQSGRVVYRFDSGLTETIATVSGTFGEPNPNARLIAASPKMLEALERAAEALEAFKSLARLPEQKQQLAEDMALIDAAIAEATGLAA